MAGWKDKVHRTSKNKAQSTRQEVHSHIRVKPAPKNRGQAQRQETCGRGQSGRAF